MFTVTSSINAFYTKLINRTLALEGWFEKPKNKPDVDE
jgi:hypothetical protein